MSASRATQNNNPVFINFGSYFYVDNVNGSNTAFFDTTAYSTVDLHCVEAANVTFANAATYNATVVATANIRSLIYDSATGTGSNTYVYKAYVANIQNQTQSNTAIAGTANTITFPNYFSRFEGAYTGVNITLTSGPGAGDFRTITSYNGTTT